MPRGPGPTRETTSPRDEAFPIFVNPGVQGARPPTTSRDERSRPAAQPYQRMPRMLHSQPMVQRERRLGP